MITDTERITSFPRPGAECCEHISSNGVFWSRGRTILRSETLEGPFERIACIPRPITRRLLGATRLGRRLARETIYNLIPMDDGSLFFSYGNEVGFIAGDVVTFLTGIMNKCRILRGGCTRLPDGSVVFGEYFDNAERTAVHIYRVEPGATRLEVVHRFSPGEVRHVHSVNWDPFTQKAVVATGDIGDECRIIAFDPDFASSQVLGMGTEDWRAISPQFTRDAVYFGTDSQFKQNRLFRCDRTTWALNAIADVNGPVFYSTQVSDGWVFGTTAELCPSQTSAEAILYHVDATTDQVHMLARFTKDRWPTRYFQFGILNFPIIDHSIGQIPVSGTALTGLDGRFVLLHDA